MSIALRTLEFLSTDSDYVPWRAMVGELSYLDLMLSRTAIYGEFEVCHLQYRKQIRKLVLLFILFVGSSSRVGIGVCNV